MVDRSHINRRIKRFICTELVPDLEESALSDDDSLLESGILDSFGIMSLLDFIQREFQVDIPAEEIEPATFETTAAIARTVGSHLRS